MIRKAKKGDLLRVMEIVKDSTRIMEGEKNPQWDDNYPAYDDFAADIDSESLYVYEDEEGIAGVLCVNTTEPAEYGAVEWARQEKAMVLHRMAVCPTRRGKNIGSVLLRFGEELAKENGTPYLKSDTYSQNPAMNYLLQKNGYRICGHMNFKGKPGLFNCYEKVPTEN